MSNSRAFYCHFYLSALLLIPPLMYCDNTSAPWAFPALIFRIYPMVSFEEFKLLNLTNKLTWDRQWQSETPSPVQRYKTQLFHVRH